MILVYSNESRARRTSTCLHIDKSFTGTTAAVCAYYNMMLHSTVVYYYCYQTVRSTGGM